MKNRGDLLIEKVDSFIGWENETAFLAFREEMLSEYDKMTECEQEEVDESMVMEHIAMIYSCYSDD